MGCYQSKSNKLNKNSSQSNQFWLSVSAYTWEKDTHNLFDYEANNIIKNQLSISENQSKQIVRKGTHVYLKNAQETLSSAEQSLCSMTFNQEKQCQIEINDSSLDLQSFQEDQQSNQNPEKNVSAWSIIRFQQSDSKNGVQLQENDVIQLGRVKLKVVEIVSNQEKNFQNSNNTNEIRNLNINADNQRSSLLQVNKQKANCLDEENVTDVDADELNHQEIGIGITQYTNQNKICKFCFNGETDKFNKLISPCKCTGTLKYVHIQCLQAWIQTKMKVSDTHSECIYFDKYIECEICKQKFSIRFTEDGTVYDMLSSFRPKNQPYFILETLEKKEKNAQHGFYLLKMQPSQPLLMGRSHECTFRIQDISVSRIHCQFVFENGSLYIQDLKSKYGSLLLVKEPMKLAQMNGQIQVQFGRTIIIFQITNSKNVSQLQNSYELTKLNEQYKEPQIYHFI